MNLKNSFDLRCLKLGLKNDYTLAVSNFTQQFVPHKWSGASKGVITKGLKLSSGDLKEALAAGKTRASLYFVFKIIDVILTR